MTELYVDANIDKPIDENEKNPHMDEVMRLLDDYHVAIDEHWTKFFAEFGKNPAPASSQHHSNVLWGTWNHLKIGLEIIFEYNQHLHEPYSEYQLAKVWLCHDLSKFYNAPVPNFKKNGGLYKTPWTYMNEGVYRPHELESILIAMKYFELDEVDRNAIYYHHGLYSKNVQANPYDKKEVMCKLAHLVHLVDMMCSNMIETVYTRND